MGIGDWGLGIGPNPQSPIPIPNPHFIFNHNKKRIINKNYIKIDIYNYKIRNILHFNMLFINKYLIR